MKYLLFIPAALILGLLFITGPVHAAIATPWNATSTDAGYISPNKINGNHPSVRADYFTATSTTAHSIFPIADIAKLGNLITNALVITSGADGTLGAYAGVSCTNQFIRALSAVGAATCATVGAADVSLANLTATDSTLTFSGTYNGSTARTIGINLTNPNTWTGLQQFNGNASTTGLTNSGQTWLTVLATAAGAFLAVDPNGKVIATSTPSGGGSVGSGTTGQFPYYAANGTTLTATSTVFVSTASNVGIGNASPAYKLDVSGSENITGAYYINGIPVEQTAGTGNYFGGGAGNLTLSSSNNTGYGYLALAALTSGGNINVAVGHNAGTGITSGGANTIVGDAAGAGLSSGNSNVVIGRSAFNSGNSSNNTIVGEQAGANTSGGPNVFVGSSAASGMSSGNFNVMIGTSVGTSSTSGGGNILIGQVLARNSTDSNFLNIGNTVYGDVSTGNFGAGTTTPWRKLSVTGTVAFDGLTAAAGTPSSICMNATTKEVVVNAALTCTVSSRRFKSDIENLTLSGTGIVMALQPSTFFYKDRLDRNRIGFIAEDLALVDPRLSEYDADGKPNSIDFSAIMGVTVQALQEVIATVRIHESRLDALEAKVAALETSNAALQMMCIPTS